MAVLGLALALLCGLAADARAEAWGGAALSVADAQASHLTEASVVFSVNASVAADARIELALADAWCDQVFATSAWPTAGLDGSLSVAHEDNVLVVTRGGDGAALPANTQAAFALASVVNPWTRGAAEGATLRVDGGPAVAVASPAIEADAALWLGADGGVARLDNASLWDSSAAPSRKDLLQVESPVDQTLEVPESMAAGALHVRGEGQSGSVVRVQSSATLALGGQPPACPLRSRPTVSGLDLQFGSVGRVLGPLFFSVNDSQVPLSELVLSLTSSNESVVSPANASFDASLTGARRSLSLVPLADGAAVATVRVYNGFKEGLLPFAVSVNISGTLGVAQFARTNVTVEEEQTVVEVWLTRSGGSLGKLRAYVWSADTPRGALAGVDYLPFEGEEVVWPTHDAEPKLVTLYVIDDLEEEPVEQFSLFLEGDAVGANDTLTVRIAAGDVPPEDATLPPALQRAWLRETAWELVVEFDVPAYCNRTLCYDVQECELDRIFSAATVADVLGGEGAECAWGAQSTTLTVAYNDSAAALEGGEALVLLGGYLRGAPSAVLTAVGLVEVEARTPAASLLSAQFSDVGSAVFVRFGGSTVLSQSGSLACADLFADVAALGLAPACSWTDSATLQVDLGLGAVLEPGEASREACPSNASLALAAGALVPVQDSVLSSAGCAPLQYPDSPPAPAPVISAPEVVAFCDAVTLDASASSGSAGRAMTFAWRAAAASPEAAAVLANVTAALAGESGDSVTLASDLVPPGAAFEFTVFAWNFLNPANASAAAAVAKSADAVPTVTIEGGSSRAVTRDLPLRLAATAASSRCGNDASATLEYTWRVVSGDVELPADLGADPRDVELPAYALMVSEQYEFEVEVRLASNAARNNSARVVVTVEPGALVARIRGGNREGLSVYRPLLLSASEDRERNDGAEDRDRLDELPWTYQWGCAPAALCGGFPAGTSSELTVPAGSLDPGLYTVSLNVSKGNASLPEPYHLRTASTSVTLLLEDVLAPPEVSAWLEGAARKPSPSERLFLLSNVSSSTDNTSLAWTVDSTAGTDSLAFATTLTRSFLIVEADVLAAGALYTFRLTVVDALGRAAFSEVEVTPNAAPALGYVAVSPAAGTVLTTEFTLSALQWTDDAEDLPLSYRFAYVQVQADGAEVEVSLSTGFSQSNKLATPLPKGRRVDGYALPLAAYVADVLGAVARSTSSSTGAALSVEVEPATTGTVSAAAIANDTAASVSDALAAGDGAAVFQVAAAVSSVIEDDCAANCDTSAGASCVNGTCVCAAGYEGDDCSTGIPVAGNWTAWSAWSECSLACGGGSTERSRSCTAPAPAFGGADCAGNATETAVCNADACEGAEVDGGYAEWGAWSDCSRVCDGSAYGTLTGSRARARTCTAPTPSLGGADCAALGAASEAEACTVRCDAPLRTCPDDCSGHGSCRREPPSCSFADAACTVLQCECSDGYGGDACQHTAAELAELQAVRESVLAQLVLADALIEQTAESQAMRADTLLLVVSEPSQLTEAAQASAGALVTSLLAGGGALAADTAATVADCVSALVESTTFVSVDDGGNGTDVFALAVESVANLSASVLDDAYPGQDPVEVVTATFALVAMREDRAAVADVALPSASVGFEAGALAGLETTGSSQAAVVGEASDVDVRATQWFVNVHAGSGGSLGENVTQVVSLSVNNPNGGAEISVAGLSAPFELRIPIAQEALAATATCAFMSSGEWTTGGLSEVGPRRGDDGELVLVCLSTHMTDFTSATGDEFSPPLNTVDPIGDANLLMTMSATTLLAVFAVATVYFLAAVGGALLWWDDRRKEAGFLRRIREHYYVHGSFTFTHTRTVSSTHRPGVEDFRRQLLASHNMLAPFFAPFEVQVGTPRPQRLLLLVNAIMFSFAAAALFFREDRTLQQDVGASIFTALMLLPINILFPLMMAHANMPPTSRNARSLAALKARTRHLARLAYGWVHLTNRTREDGELLVEDGQGDYSPSRTPSPVAVLNSDSSSEDEDVEEVELTPRSPRQDDDDEDAVIPFGSPQLGGPPAVLLSQMTGPPAIATASSPEVNLVDFDDLDEDGVLAPPRGAARSASDVASLSPQVAMRGPPLNVQPKFRPDLSLALVSQVSDSFATLTPQRTPVDPRSLRAKKPKGSKVGPDATLLGPVSPGPSTARQVRSPIERKVWRQRLAGLQQFRVGGGRTPPRFRPDKRVARRLPRLETRTVEPPYALPPSEAEYVNRAPVSTLGVAAVLLTTLLGGALIAVAGTVALLQTFGLVAGVAAAFTGVVTGGAGAIGIVAKHHDDRLLVKVYVVVGALALACQGFTAVWTAGGAPALVDAALAVEWQRAVDLEETGDLLELQVGHGCCGLEGPADMGVDCVELGLNASAGCLPFAREEFADNVWRIMLADAVVLAAQAVALALALRVAVHPVPLVSKAAPKMAPPPTNGRELLRMRTDPEKLRLVIRVQAAFRGLMGRKHAARMREVDAWLALRAQRARYSRLATAIVLIVSLGMMYINLIYSVKFDEDTAVAWLTSALASQFISSLLVQPFRIFALLVVKPVLLDIRDTWRAALALLARESVTQAKTMTRRASVQLGQRRASLSAVASPPSVVWKLAVAGGSAPVVPLVPPSAGEPQAPPGASGKVAPAPMAAAPAPPRGMVAPSISLIEGGGGAGPGPGPVRGTVEL